MDYQATFGTEGVLAHDALIAGNAHLLVGRKITIAAGQNLVRGAVLGKVTATGKYLLSLSAAADGSQTPDLILAEDCNASAADKSVLAYARGDFNSRALTLGAAHTVASITEGLRAKGITLLASIA
ncbi:head decoration protein [Malikia spinosa]|uniref:Head decoration protein n=1 Tax=Malikia spinosa TaxID=86180 RepID=A0A2S9KEA6_9BURK|nr:head decoration protein [Malikia spinosa]PRD68773.1 head decoration protein [Malikia spinosa]